MWAEAACLVWHVLSVWVSHECSQVGTSGQLAGPPAHGWERSSCKILQPLWSEFQGIPWSLPNSSRCSNASDLILSRAGISPSGFIPFPPVRHMKSLGSSKAAQVPSQHADVWASVGGVWVCGKHCVPEHGCQDISISINGCFDKGCVSVCLPSNCLYLKYSRVWVPCVNVS